MDFLLDYIRTIVYSIIYRYDVSYIGAMYRIFGGVEFVPQIIGSNEET
ncbi:hypothetical protein M4L39_06675 [Staphylococcus equorum]|nr:hypothetical protein [Staphylococcus equorum]MDG0843121.1 hypothetical protein [Staphylococcus equorum]